MSGFKQVLACAAALALTTGATAAERYAYKFTRPLKYRTVLLSEGQFSLPDGTPRKMKLEAVSTVQLTPVGQDAHGFQVTTETLRTMTRMDDREVPAPKPADSKRTVTVGPDGAITGGGESTFAIVFPAKALSKGDSFTEERATPAGGPALPLKTVYTVADTAATVPGYAGAVTLFEARSELSGKPQGRQLTLKEGGGKVWFDAAAGLLVKSHLAYVFSEETPLPGGQSGGSRVTTVHYESELAK